MVVSVASAAILIFTVGVLCCSLVEIAEAMLQHKPLIMRVGTHQCTEEGMVFVSDLRMLKNLKYAYNVAYVPLQSRHVFA